MSDQKFIIKIELPKNRYEDGKLWLCNSRGAQIMAAISCLGKADNARAIKANNKSRNSVEPYGDTPTGIYKKSKIVIFKERHRSIGHGWIALSGLSGKAAIASNKRTGLGIHGGRGSIKLIPTYGCVRILDHDFDALYNAVGDNDIYVEINEAGEVICLRPFDNGNFLYNREGNINPCLMDEGS